MTEHLDQGDVADTVSVFFEKSGKLPPQRESSLTLQEVDGYLEQMSQVTKEDDQQAVLTSVAKRWVRGEWEKGEGRREGVGKRGGQQAGMLPGREKKGEAITVVSMGSGSFLRSLMVFSTIRPC